MAYWVGLSQHCLSGLGHPRCSRDEAEGGVALAITFSINGGARNSGWDMRTGCLLEADDGRPILNTSPV